LNPFRPPALSANKIDWKARCAVVIPCFNEEVSIGNIVRDVRSFVSQIIVVDDGSNDDTAAAAARAGAVVLRNSKKNGKGQALRMGWRQAQTLGFDWVLSMDGDGQHAPGDIPQFFAAADKNPASLIVGNRMENSARMPWARRCVNRVMSRCLSNLTGVRLADSQCGFRLAPTDALLRLSLSARGFVMESEMWVAWIAAGKAVAFVPVQTIYGQEKSKIRPLLDAWHWMRWWSIRSAGTFKS
jgi:glycosyltransferase involved in cell wall biosynthesis